MAQVPGHQEDGVIAQPKRRLGAQRVTLGKLPFIPNRTAPIDMHRSCAMPSLSPSVGVLPAVSPLTPTSRSTPSRPVSVSGRFRGCLREPPERSGKGGLSPPVLGKKPHVPLALPGPGRACGAVIYRGMARSRPRDNIRVGPLMTRVLSP
jgi:hypothetical protein